MAHFLGGQVDHITADGTTESRGNSEAVIEHPLVQKTGDNGLSLDMGKIS